ncbi:MAG: glutaredoxin domain-containing protein [Desulfobulbaceae bacterium]|nr:glutaredoxin domain-containing protein [Desulfobulbaceae bacterium]
MAKKIEVYSMKTCPHCIQAKGLLQSRGVAFEEILIGMNDNAAWDMLYKKSGGMKTVPQIYCDGKILGGFPELSALDKTDGLASLK